MKNKAILSIILSSIFALPSLTMDSKSDLLTFNDTILQKASDHVVQTNKSYTTTEHKPLLIMLSGCSGMGKTTIAKLLEEKLNVLRFNGDDTRIFLRDQGCFHVSLRPEEKVAMILSCFSHFAHRAKNEFANKTIIFDESIDRQKPPIFKQVSEIAQKLDLPTFVIRLKVSKETAWNRLKDREKENPANMAHYERHFSNYYETYESFDHKAVDFVLDNESSSESISKDLLEKIKKQIDSKEQ